MKEPKTARKKWFEQRDDLTGEHALGDAGQIIFALLFFGIWIADSFFLKYTTPLNDIVPALIRKPIGIVLLCLSAYCAWSGLRIVFGEVRETPSVIREGVFGVVRHPIYLSEVLLYFGLFILNMSLAAGAVWIGATVFFVFFVAVRREIVAETLW